MWWMKPSWGQMLAAGLFPHRIRQWGQFWSSPTVWRWKGIRSWWLPMAREWPTKGRDRTWRACSSPSFPSKPMHTQAITISLLRKGQFQAKIEQIKVSLICAGSPAFRRWALTRRLQPDAWSSNSKNLSPSLRRRQLRRASLSLCAPRLTAATSTRNGRLTFQTGHCWARISFYQMRKRNRKLPTTRISGETNSRFWAKTEQPPRVAVFNWTIRVKLEIKCWAPSRTHLHAWLLKRLRSLASELASIKQFRWEKPPTIILVSPSWSSIRWSRGVRYLDPDIT